MGMTVATIVNRLGTTMKKNWDVICDILIEVEGLSPDERNRFSYGLGKTYATQNPTISEHALLLYKAGYLSGIPNATIGSPAIRSPELTWKGHDLLDTIRSRPVWERIKTISMEKGIEITFDSLKGLSKVALDWVLAQ